MPAVTQPGIEPQFLPPHWPLCLDSQTPPLHEGTAGAVCPRHHLCLCLMDDEQETGIHDRVTDIKYKNKN